MTGKTDNLERRLQWVAQLPVVLFAILLAGGLALHVFFPATRVSVVALNAGLVVVMLSPVVRLMLAAAERIRRRDWLFVVMTVVVALEIGLVMWRAAQKI